MLILIARNISQMTTGESQNSESFSSIGTKKAKIKAHLLAHISN